MKSKTGKEWCKSVDIAFLSEIIVKFRFWQEILNFMGLKCCTVAFVAFKLKCDNEAFLFHTTHWFLDIFRFGKKLSHLANFLCDSLSLCKPFVFILKINIIISYFNRVLYSTKIVWIWYSNCLTSLVDKLYLLHGSKLWYQNVENTV